MNMLSIINISYYFAGSHGDIECSSEDLAKPLLDGSVDPGVRLTLLDYFNAVRDFLVASNGEHLVAALRRRIGRQIATHEIESLAIHSAKMGAFYHVARVDVVVAGATHRLAVSTAASRPGRECLSRDYANTRELLSLRPELDMLAVPYFSGKGGEPSFLHALADWLEDFHEWHLSDSNGVRDFMLWDWGQGFRRLTPVEGHAIIRESARILAAAFEPETGRHIRSWHHAAGDFIARVDNAGVAVRLTTVREYAPFPELPEYHPALALVLHLVETSVLLRLDKLDGVGKTVWLDDPAVWAAVDGFFQGLTGVSLPFGSASDALAFVCAFSPAELGPLLDLVLARLKAETPSDFEVAAPHAAEHLTTLHQVLQNVTINS